MAALFLNDGFEAMAEGGAGLLDLHPIHVVHSPHNSILQLLLGVLWEIVNLLLQNTPDIIVQWVMVRTGGWPEVRRPAAGSCWSTRPGSYGSYALAQSLFERHTASGRPLEPSRAGPRFPEP